MSMAGTLRASLCLLGGLSLMTATCDGQVADRNASPDLSAAATLAATGAIAPTITWANPIAIRYGKALTSTQLNAKANVPGTLVYTPAAGVILHAGLQTLSAVFTPTDSATYAAVSKTVNLQVTQVVPMINWPSPASIQQGTALSAIQLNATSNVFGTFTYRPGAGTVLPAGIQQLTVTFAPNNRIDDAAAIATTSITVMPSITQPTSCGGPTIKLNGSMSTSTIQSAINGAPNCSVILFAAGTYNITSQISIPCPSSGFTISGPIVPWPGPYDVTLNGAVAGNWGFAFGPCSSPVTIQYLEWNGGEPSNGGGGFLYVSQATSNLTVQYNYLHGNQADVNDGHEFDSLIWLDGVDSAPPNLYDSNDTIAWNVFGNSNDGTPTNADCGAISDLFNYQGSNYDGSGGQCAAIGLHSSTNNFTVTNNIIRYQEQGVKLYEGGSVASQLFYDANLNFTYNDLSWIHRIGLEGQQDGNPTMNFNYNDMHDQAYPAYGSWGFSLPEGGASNCEHNVLIANLTRQGAANAGPGAVEFWGNGSCSNNLVQGYWGAGIQFGFGNPPWAIDNNIIQQLTNTSYINNEENTHCCFPEMSGNAGSQQLAAVTSAAPTISSGPGGNNSSPVTVTLTDMGATNGGVGPQGNTTIYYTTDGSTPTTSSAACNPTPGSTSCSISVAVGTTVKAIGMWGAINQPKSYPTGYGFVPSKVVSATM
jgi:hypothetical protein